MKLIRRKYHKRIQRPFRWKYRTINSQHATDLATRHGFSPLLSRIIAARLHEAPSEALDKFLRPALATLHDPFLLADMEPAVKRCAEAVRRREKIVIYGDYDADGITATALLVHLFRFLDHDVEYYIPHRVEEGYGLQKDALAELSKQGTKVVITVDNGITAIEEAKEARRRNIDLIITDHHQPADTLPDAVAAVDPNRRDCPYPCKFLTGVGVAFKFAHGLLKYLGTPPEKGREFLRSVLDLVAIGTIADQVPLLDENRVLVTYGLEQMRSSPSVRIRSMLDMWSLPRDFSSQTVAFQIAPRLNAAGRIDHAAICVQLLTAQDDTEARAIAYELDTLNLKRRELEAQLFQMCRRYVDKHLSLEDEPVLIVPGAKWHRGIIGVAATRLAELYHRPAIVISVEDEVAHGSGRSPASFNLLSALEAVKDHLLEYGGHLQAAGLSLTAANIDSFRDAINSYAHMHLEPDDLVPELTIDTPVEPHELDIDLVKSLKTLEPFGDSNPPVVLSMEGVRLASSPQLVGAQRNHIRLAVASNGAKFDVIGYNLGELIGPLQEQAGSHFDIVFTPSINTYFGTEDLQLELKDLCFS